jgi:hypothetical protein
MLRLHDAQSCHHQKRKRKKKIMFEGFINEHHLFEDARYASCEAVWFFPSFSPSLLTGEGGPVGSLGCSVVQGVRNKGGSQSSQAGTPRDT